MKTTLRIVSVLCVLLLLTWNAPAQDASTAQLHGLVRDPKGALVQGAKVTVKDEQRGLERTTTTDQNGEYQLLQLVPGRYTVSVEAPGFAKWTSKDVILTIGQAAELPVAMSVESATAEVTVSAEAELIETQRSSGTTTIGQDKIENLPINGRNYINFSLTDSQVARDTAPSIGAAPTSGLNFNGQRARSNLVNMDGADNVDASVNGIRSTVSQDAVQEFQIIKDGYAAEYGRASGGVVNIITKSGSNAWHGSAFGYLRNRNLQAQNPFTNVPDPAYTRAQYGAAFGGPIVKDKTFYFVSYEGTRRHETGFSTMGDDCNGGVTCFGLVTTDVSSKFLAPAGSFVIQATPAQAAVLAALPPSATSQAYSFFVGSASAIGLYGTMVGNTGSIGLNNTLFNLFGGATPNFASSCNIVTNILCHGLPGQYAPLNLQRGNYPVFEGTSLWSARIDHHFTNNNTAMLRVNVSPSTQTGIQVNAQNQNFGQNAYSRTSIQTYRDAAGTAQDTWLIGSNKVNEFRFQYARRGLKYDFNTLIPEGGDVAVNIAGFGFIGREPFSVVDRVEQRWQFADNFSWVHGNHTVKFGADFQYIPVDASFTVNFGNVYNFGALSGTQIGFPGLPGMSPVQAYGFGVPSTMVQGIGNPRASFNVKPVGFYIQDSWRIHPRLTMNIGVRYDVEFSEKSAFPNTLSADSYAALGIQKGFGTDADNIGPRIGIAWDPWGDGKTVVRANYGMFYDNPLLGLLFLGSATDGVGTPQLILFGGSPCNSVAVPSPLNLNATNVFQGILGTSHCLPPGAATNMGYLPNQQQFDSFDPTSSFINQNYLDLAGGTFQPLSMQPFGFPEGEGFEHAYTQQAGLSVERELGRDWSLSVAYNFAHGSHLNRPINANPVRGDLLVQNWYRAVFIDGVPITTSPLSITTCDPAHNIYPAALTSFFRPSGLNPSLAPVFGAGCTAAAAAFLVSQGLGTNAPTCAISPQCIPFSDMVANYSNGSSVYHALTTNLKKRMGNHWEMLASYTWSHTIDDSTDLQSLLSPQDSYFPYKERANSTFDQRHKLVVSGIYQSGRVGEGFWGHVFSDWTIAPLIEIASGRPFTILTAEPVNFQFSPNSSRPNIVPAGTATNSCGFAAQASTYSPTGFFQTPCFINAVIAGGGTLSLDQLDGNLGRNTATKPMTVFNDIRVARRIHLSERVKLDAIADMFNMVNRFNVADVSPLCSSTSCTAGTPSAAFDPRQIQLGLKLTW
ncbi:MAG: TonB-dependent receptor [Acidobacteriota bacterium]|nr:TonB-dependent receptor [Acidobacteriota bacterium]